MNIDEKCSISFLTIIASRKQGDALLTALLDTDIHLIYTSYGTGTVSAHFLKKAFGLASEKHKVVISCVSTNTKIDAFLKVLTKQFDFGKPNMGIAFTTPVEQIG